VSKSIVLSAFKAVYSGKLLLQEIIKMSTNTKNNADIKEVEKTIEKINKEQDETLKENKNKNIKTKVGVIGIPHMGTFPWQTVMSLLTLKRPENTIIKYHLIGSSLIYDARDNIVKYALKENADWIFFMDSDMVIPSNILVRFTNLYLENKKVEMVSGMAFKRIPPYQPCFYSKVRFDKENKKPKLESPIEFPDKGLICCEGMGMACVYIDTNVIRKIKKMYEDKGQESNYFFPYPHLGEDLSFCYRARMAGVNMYTDLEIDVLHVGSMAVGKKNFILARDAHKKANTGKPLFQETV
jgi:hypothetical protein